MKFHFLILSSLLWLLCSCTATNPLREVVLKKEFNRYEGSDKIEFLQTLKRELPLNNFFGVEKKTVWPLLIRRLAEIAEGDSDALVRSVALETLATLTGVQGQPYYLRGLKDSSFIVRYQSLQILQKYGNNRSIQPLLQTLKSDFNFHCRREAARALSNFKNPPIVPDLVSALAEEENYGVRYEIYITLLKITRESLPFDADAWQEWQKSKKSG